MAQLIEAAPPRVAVLIPCYNEEATVAAVVASFRSALPDAPIYVYDNNSKDATAAVAAAAGAIVVRENYQGKGSVVRRMFADVEADIYLMVDGDDTYDASAAPALIRKFREEGLDLLNVARVDTAKGAYRMGHRFGNMALTTLVRMIFGRQFTDMLSGYKLFSRRYVKSFPALSFGFEIETELTIHALELRMPCGEASADYGERPEGSTSKLRTFRDGWIILLLILKLVKEERPLQFFGFAGLGAMLMAVLLGTPLVWTYLETGLVPRLPTALLAVGLMVIGFIAVSIGLVLDSVTLARQEAKRMRYLAFPLTSDQVAERGHRSALSAPTAPAPTLGRDLRDVSRAG